MEVAPSPSWRRYHLIEQADEARREALAAVRAGEVIVVPTDTVYGVAVDATNAAAVDRLLAAKVRGREMPPPVLISDALMLGSLADEVPEAALALIEQCWPGPLTVVLKAQAGLGMDLGDTQGTVAVRIPDHEGTRELLRLTGPLAVSSANVSGNPAATSIEEAIDQLGDSIAVYLDAGPSDGQVASSIVDFSGSQAEGQTGRLLRPGAVPIERLVALVPDLDLAEWAPQPEAEAEGPGLPSLPA